MPLFRIFIGEHMHERLSVLRYPTRTWSAKWLHQLLPTHAQANKFDGGTRKCPVCPSTREDHHLPTHAQANKFDGGTRKCPVCPSTREDHHHILRCNPIARSAWRTEFLHALRDYLLLTNTSPLLSALLLQSLRQCFSSSSEIHLSPEDYHLSLRHIIKQQNRIGWSQLFPGRFSVSWCARQRWYLSNQHSHATEDLKNQACRGR
jgi:hypothetical protein